MAEGLWQVSSVTMVATVPLDVSYPQRTGSGASTPVIGGVCAQIFKKQRPRSEGDLVSSTSAVQGAP